MLIFSPRLKRGDMDAWGHWAANDLAYSGSRSHRRAVEKAEERIAMFFLGRERGWISTSWGKDSVCAADMAYHLTEWPLVWIRVEPIASPECVQVRDEFAKRKGGDFDVRYREIRIDLEPDADGRVHATGSLERGIRQAEKEFGPNRILGLRGAESGSRKRMQKRGQFITSETCYPILDWNDSDVFAHLARYDLPIHPAYAMSMSGAIPRGRLRVASLTGQRGGEFGREEWEDAYYPDFAKFR